MLGRPFQGACSVVEKKLLLARRTHASSLQAAKEELAACLLL